MKYNLKVCSRCDIKQDRDNFSAKSGRCKPCNAAVFRVCKARGTGNYKDPDALKKRYDRIIEDILRDEYC